MQFEEVDRAKSLSIFKDTTATQLCGIKRPDYLSLPERPQRINEHSPEAKLIVVLKNPIQRAVSAYYHYISNRYLRAVEPNEGL